VVFFLFQAEDGIRDWSVTGVQTCALPILLRCGERRDLERIADLLKVEIVHFAARRIRERLQTRPARSGCHREFGRRPGDDRSLRSEERRVGKEWRDRVWTYDERRRAKAGG